MKMIPPEHHCDVIFVPIYLQMINKHIFNFFHCNCCHHLIVLPQRTLADRARCQLATGPNQLHRLC